MKRSRDLDQQRLTDGKRGITSCSIERTFGSIAAPICCKSRKKLIDVNLIAVEREKSKEPIIEQRDLLVCSVREVGQLAVPANHFRLHGAREDLPHWTSPRFVCLSSVIFVNLPLLSKCQTLFPCSQRPRSPLGRRFAPQILLVALAWTGSPWTEWLSSRKSITKAQKYVMVILDDPC